MPLVILKQGSTLEDSSSDREQTRIRPDILVAGGQQEAPPRREREVRKHLRAPLGKVLNVEWHEEVRVAGQLLASPDEPAGRAILRRVPHPVQRDEPITHGPRDPHLRRRISGDWRDAEPCADRLLLRGHDGAHPSPQKSRIALENLLSKPPWLAEQAGH